MHKFQLFRIKIILKEAAQMSIVNNLLAKSRKDLLLETIKTHPSATLRKNQNWQLVSSEEIDERSCYFQIGKRSSSASDQFDTESGRYVVRDSPKDSFTHAIIDAELQVCAIASRQTLPNPIVAAKYLGKLLENTTEFQNVNAEVIVAQITDPTEFIELLKSAYEIRSFKVEVSPPNIFDVNEDFIRPAQKCIAETNADIGLTELRGNDLNRDVLVDITRSSSATGNHVEARLKQEENSRPVKRKADSSPATITNEDIDTASDRMSILSKMRNLYARIRNSMQEE